MKKVILIAASIFALASCNKDVNVTSGNVGYLNFNLAADDVVVTTKAVTDGQLNAYTVYVGETFHTYGDIKGKALELKPATYPIYAENMTPNEAHDGNGALRLASPSQEVTITAGKTEDVTLACEVVNAKITVNFDASFKAAFSSWNVVLGYDGDASRNFTITHETVNTEYFYNIHSEGKGLKLSLTAIPEFDPENVKSNVAELAIEARHHYTVNYSAGTSGYVNITVTADDTLIEEDPQNITVNPYQSEPAE